MTRVGVESTTSEARVISRSLARYCRVAVHAPSATPRVMPSREPIVTSRSETHTRVLIVSLMLSPNGVRPQSQSVTTPVSQVQYRSSSGTRSLRLYALSDASTTAGSIGGLRASYSDRGSRRVAASRYTRDTATTSSTA